MVSVVSETSADILYKVSAEWSPVSEFSIGWNDPDLAIQWPIKTPLLSEKDKASQSFKEWCRADSPKVSELG